MAEQIYEITGYINKLTQKSRIEYKTKNVIPAEFIIQTIEGPCYQCVCPFYKPLDEGDIITGKVKLVSVPPMTQILHFVQDPLVHIPTDADNVKQCFIRALRTTGFGGVSADKLYEGLMEMTKIHLMMRNIPSLDEIKVTPQIEETPIEVKGLSKNNPVEHLIEFNTPTVNLNRNITSQEVIDYLTNLGVKYHNEGNRSIAENLAQECNIKVQQAVLLLNWWYKERSIRRLNLLGIDDEEIKACHMPLDEIYLICIGDGKKTGNPFKLAPISMEKCYNIMRFINVIPSPIEISCGQVVRRIYENLIRSGWTCTPVWSLQRQFTNFYALRDILIKEYDVFIEYECAYLKYPYTVETTVAKYIDHLISTTAEKLNELPDRDLPNLETAYYHCKTLTTEQKIAIQGALNHDISIITGGSGTGKCLSPDTPVVMFNGEVKVAKEIVEGDLLMGMDSKPREVISTTRGVGYMYAIKPTVGKAFSCNGEHILTLRGIKPSLIKIDDYFIVTYSSKGWVKSHKFPTYLQAKNCYDSVEEDIFDIPMNDFISRSPAYKGNVSLIHQGVEFPESPLPLGGYAFGLKWAHLNFIREDHGIPELYKINSRENRLALLAGFLDGDYYSAKKGYYLEIYGKTLMKDIEYVAYSLGIIADTTFHLSKKYYHIEFLGPIVKEIPTLHHFEVMPVDTSFSVRYMGIGNYNGFELSGDGRFLLGDFTVTHNSTIIGEITRNLKLRECLFAIGSPTGKSASRVNDILGTKTAQTLDRMIVKANDVKFPYLIIDETSMVTTELFYRFIKTFGHSFRIIIVGDINQLQPIGWGSFMKSIIGCNRVPKYELTYNHRIVEHITNPEELKLKTELALQRGDIAPGLEKFDRIILENANALIAPGRNMSEPLIFNQGKGFSIINGGTPVIHTIVSSLAKMRVRPDDICIISPFNQFINELNEIFRQVYYADAKYMIDAEKNIWYPGARVMMLVNNYDINVMNGDEGVIQGVDDSGVKVKFKDGAVHLFRFDKANTKWKSRSYKNMTTEGEAVGVEEDTKELLVEHLQISFAITVYKSQGSEVQYVIFYIPARYGNGKMTASASFININLLYTGITRVKRAIWIVGDEQALVLSTCRTQPIRYENLCPRLVNMKDKDKEVKIGMINSVRGVKEGEVEIAVVEEDIPEHEDMSMYEEM